MGNYSTIPFKSKLTLASRSSRESRFDSRLLHLDSRFLQDSSNLNGLCIQLIIHVKGFEYFALYSRYSIAARIYNLCSSFEQSSNFSHIKKNLSTLLNNKVYLASDSCEKFLNYANYTVVVDICINFLLTWHSQVTLCRNLKNV